MPLTPEDVHKKTFTPVRLREGYDQGEVDQFLDEVEGELKRLHQEIDELRAKAGTAAGVAGAAPVATDKPAPKAEATPASPAELPAVKTVPEASSAAARLLEIATNNAEQLVAEAKSEAETIVGEARTTAERVESEAKTRADSLDADARSRSEQLDSETDERRQQLLGELEHEKTSLAEEVEGLRSFEREYRSRLKEYFEGQLRTLEGDVPPETSDPLVPSDADADTTPRRLRELMGEDS